MAATLLLADDSVTIQRVIELTFADEDVDVITVSDGDQAIAEIERQPPDIVLADVGMPGRTGYDVAGYVKDSPRLAHIPVILLTGAFEPVDQRRANAARCDAVLAKPFEPQLVISRVKELLNRSRSGAGGSVHATASDAPEAARPSPAPISLVEPIRTGASSTSLNDYFDQLDAAFAKLPSTDAEVQDWPIRQPPDEPEPQPTPELALTTEAEARDDVWEIDVADTWKPDVPVSFASPPEAFEAPAPPVAAPAPPAPPVEAPAPLPPPSQPTPVPAMLERPLPAVPQRPKTIEPPPPPSTPGLGDAFAALLAAEQAHDPSAVAVDWTPRPVLTDEAIDHIVERVLARMSDAVGRATVADIVATVAERLVREEIERIKAAIE